MSWRRTFVAFSRRCVCGAVLAGAYASTSVVAAPGTATGPAAAGASIGVELHDGALTLRAVDAPLVEVIRVIGAQAGFETLVYGRLDVPLTRALKNVPLEHALRLLLEDVSNVLWFEQSGTRQVTQVLLFGTDADVSVAPPPEVAPSTVIVTSLDSTRATSIATTQEHARAGDAAARGELTRLLREDTDPAVRSEAARALGALGDEAIVVDLQAGAYDAEQRVRIGAIRALAGIDSALATQALAGVLFSHADTRTRLLAVWALGQQDTPLARSYLEAARADAEPLVQQAVARTRAELGERGTGEAPPAAPLDP